MKKRITLAVLLTVSIWLMLLLIIIIANSPLLTSRKCKGGVWVGGRAHVRVGDKGRNCMILPDEVGDYEIWKVR